MKLPCVLIAAVLLSFNVAAQIIDLKKEVDWTRIECALSKSDKLAMLTGINADLFYYLEDNHLLEESLDNFHFVDLDDDGWMDFTFEGYGGGESQNIAIFHQYSKGRFKKIFSQNGGFYSFRRIGLLSSLYELQMLRDDYAFEGLGTIKATYLIDIKGENKTIESLVFHYETVFPEETVPKKKFKVVNPKYYLRISPEINNEGNKPDVLFGNVVAEYGEGAQGYAFASKEDETGRVWWYVAVKGSESVQSIYDNKEGYYLGWMSSRFLEEL